MSGERSAIRRRYVRDALGLVAVPAVVAAIAVFFPAASDRLAYRFETLNPLAMWLASLVHAGPAHLVGNLLGYAGVVVPLYGLHLALDARRRFWSGLTAVLVGAPVLGGLTSYLGVRMLLDLPGATARGFSGTVAGVGGFLLVTTAAAVAVWGDDRRALAAAAVLVGGAVGVVVPSVPAPLVWLLAPLGVVLTVLAGRSGTGAGSGSDGDAATTLRAVRSSPRLGVAVLLAGATLAVLYVARGLFPAVVVVDGTVTGVYAHGGGAVWGVIVGCWLVLGHDDGDSPDQ